MPEELAAKTTRPKLLVSVKSNTPPAHQHSTTSARATRRKGARNPAGTWPARSLLTSPMRYLLRLPMCAARRKELVLWRSCVHVEKDLSSLRIALGTFGGTRLLFPLLLVLPLLIFRCPPLHQLEAPRDLELARIIVALLLQALLLARPLLPLSPLLFSPLPFQLPLPLPLSLMLLILHEAVVAQRQHTNIVGIVVGIIVLRLLRMHLRYRPVLSPRPSSWQTHGRDPSRRAPFAALSSAAGRLRQSVF